MSAARFLLQSDPRAEVDLQSDLQATDNLQSKPRATGNLQSDPVADLQALQCHFTWDLNVSRSRLLRLRDNLEDIGSEEGYAWLGHIYNLQGFIHHRLGLNCDALRFFSCSAEAFRQIRNTVSDDGPWLLVNYGNMAWLHRHLGERAESRKYLSKAEALIRELPPPEQEELHPEVYAEKAWTLMNLGRRPEAAALFQRAIQIQPDHEEWHSSHVMALIQPGPNQDDNVFQRMKIAKDHDSGNLYLAALYLEACARKGLNVETEARELAIRVLRKPVSSYSGLKPLLRLYMMKVSMSEAVDLAEEALRRHPDQRYLKDCAALCYEKRIVMDREHQPEQNLIDRAVRLHTEVISLYPHSCLKRKISLANIYAQWNRDKAERIYKELLLSAERGDLDAEEAQMVYNRYARFLYFSVKKTYESFEYHMMAAANPPLTFYGQDSLRILQRIRNRNDMSQEIDEFLSRLLH